MTSPWPPVAHETLPWVSTLPTEYLTRRQRAELRPTFEATVPPSIAEAPWTPPAPLLADLDDITAEISRFDAESPLALAPYAGLLLRSEAAASSRIEHLTASARAILAAEVGDRSRRNATEIAQNTAALVEAIEPASEPDAAALLSMHATLLGGVDPQAGQWRREQVWVGGSDLGPFGAVHVGPTAERVPGLIEDLVVFMRRDDLPVLAHAALAHAQFETIHPFADGNGRTGRVLVHTMLHRAGVTRRLTVPVSAGLLQDTESYFRALTAYREGEIEPIIARFTEAAFAGVGNGRALVSDLQSVTHGWLDVVTARRHATVWRVLPVLAEQPAVTVPYLQRRLDVSQPAAQHAVDQLLDAEILTPTSAGRRNRVWVAQEIVDALDGFAARARRR